MITGSMIAYAIVRLFDVLEYILLAWVVLSWFIRDPDHPVMRLLGAFVDPFIIPIRKGLEKIGLNTGFLDFSPVFAIILMRVVRGIVLNLLRFVL